MDLRFNRGVFGANSPLFLLKTVLRCHLSFYQNVESEFEENMSKSFHVDDLVLRPASTTAAYSLYCKARVRTMEGGFSIGKLKTNDSELKRVIFEEEIKDSANVVEAKRKRDHLPRK